MENYMNVKDFFAAINVELEIVALVSGSYDVRGRYCEIKDGCILATNYGRGDTRKKALDDYAANISGKRLVVNAMGPDRKEYDVPNLVPKPRVIKKKKKKKTSGS
jgi:hypothetical protein